MIMCLSIMPDTAARMYPDDHIDKGIETAYASFSPTHWMNEWLTENTGNYSWTVLHMMALSDEYTHRNFSDHPRKDDIDRVYFGARPSHVPDGALSSFPIDLPDEFREVRFTVPRQTTQEIHLLDYAPLKDAVDMYRDYVLSSGFEWTGRCTPPYWKTNDEILNSISEMNGLINGGI